MDSVKQVQVLQMAYAGALADTVLQYGREGILDRITARKHQEQIDQGKMSAAQFGVNKPEEAFLKISELFNCANWTITPNDNGFSARAGNCKLCSIAKKLGAQSPCHLYCLDPVEGMVKAVRSNATIAVHKTVWDGTQCNIQVSFTE